MSWRILAALLLVAWANAERSPREAEETTASLLEEQEGQDQGYPTATLKIDSVEKSGIFGKVENSSDGDMNLKEPVTDGEVLIMGDGEEENMTAIEELNITSLIIDIFKMHDDLNDSIMENNKSDHRLSLDGHFVRDADIIEKRSEKEVDEAKDISALNLTASGSERNMNGSNENEMNFSEQKEGEQFNLTRDRNESGDITDENSTNPTIHVKKVSGQEVTNKILRAILQNLLNNLTQTTKLHSPSSSLFLDALKPFGIALQNITISDYIPNYENIVSNHLYTLGIFLSSPFNPAGGVFLETNWKRWDIGVPIGGLIDTNEPLEAGMTLEQVVGVLFDGITFRQTALLTSQWNTTEFYTLLYQTRYYEHRRMLDVFLYDPEGDGNEVEVFWEPFSVAWTKVRCEVWVPEQGWDGGRCDRDIFGSGLVGCRCQGATFDERGVRRGRILIVEESEMKDSLTDKKYFERIALHLRNHKVDANGLEDIRNVVKKVLSLRPNIFLNDSEENSDVLIDISSELFKIHATNESVLLDVTPAVSLVVLASNVSQDGFYFVKRWPTDNPEDAVYHATGLRSGGPSPVTSDTEVFAVRIAGNASLPHRASLLLSSWEKNGELRRYFFKVVCFTQRFAELAFSAEDNAVEGDGVNIVFETSTKDWTDIRCSTYNYDRVIWNVDPCVSKSISSRLHSCNCPKSLFKVGVLLRARLHITEESINRKIFADWDLFNRTSHHLSHLSQLSLPGNQLSNVTTILDSYVLRKVRINNFILPSRVLDNLAAILHRLVLDPNNPAAFSWRSDLRSTASLFVEDRVNDSLATVAISEKNGYVWNSTLNDVTDTTVAVSFSVPQNGVSRVALTYVTTTSRIQVEDRIIHRNRRMLDVTWRRSSPSVVSQNVILHLKPFADRTGPVTVRSKKCRYWDFDRHDWSDGCAIRLENNKELCECKILLNNDSEIVHARFHIASDWSVQAVLSSSVPFFLLLTSELTLQMLIFHTGCALSLFGLVTVFVTALAFKSWRQRLSNKILLHICSALLLQILSVLFYYVVYHPFFFEFFDFVPEHREWTYLCLAMGVVWSYSYLARWSWMLVMSLLQLMRIVTVMGARNVPNLVRKVSIFAWGGPFIVLGYFLSDPWAYFDDFNRRFYFLTYLLPLSVVLVANLAVFATILARALACCGWGKMADLERHGANSWSSIWKRLRTVIVLFFTLEMTWLFELFIYFGYYNAFLHAMSFVVTAFHGFGTFLVFVVLDGDAQAGWRAALRSPRSLRKMAFLYCLVLAIIGLALVVVVVGAVLIVCLPTLA